MDDETNQWYPVTRIYTDATGVTHFEDGEVVLHPGGEIGSLSESIQPSSLVLRRTDAGYDYDWHPTPARQFIFLMTGSIEIEVGDGEKRTFSGGTTLFLEDTEPPGHRTRNVGPTPRWSAFVQTDAPVDYRRRRSL